MECDAKDKVDKRSFEDTTAEFKKLLAESKQRETELASDIGDLKSDMSELKDMLRTTLSSFGEAITEAKIEEGSTGP